MPDGKKQTVETPPGFDVWDYLELLEAEIDRQLATGEIAEAAKENNLKPDAYAKEVKKYYYDLVLSVQDPSMLPDWNAIRGDWVTSKGDVIIPNQLIRTPDGTYYDFRGFPLDSSTVSRELADYLGTEKSASEAESFKLAWAKYDLDKQMWETGQKERQEERLGQQQWARMKSQSESLQREQMPFQAEAIEQQKLRAMAEAWEAGKGASVSNDPRNWIQRYINERRPNPYREQLEQMRLSPLQERERALIESQGAAGQVAWGEFGNPASPLNPSLVAGQNDRTMWLAGQLTLREKEYKEELAATKEQAKALDYITNPAKYQDLPLAKQQQMAALGQEVATGGLEHWQVEAQQRAGQPTTPEIPQWMSRMTGLKGNVPTAKTEIPTPSGQAWTGLTGSQRQQFAGLVDFASQVPFGDILDRMAMMQGGTPTGARYARVKPSIQLK